MIKERKNFKYYWEFIEAPVIVLIIWTIITLVLPIKDFIPSTVLNVIGWVITILVFGYVGYVVVRENSNSPKDCAKAGAYAGVISGLVGAIATIIVFHVSPELFNETLQQMIAGGLDPESANTFLKIGIYSGIITGTLISGILGAFISWISGLIFRKKK